MLYFLRYIPIAINEAKNRHLFEMLHVYISDAVLEHIIPFLEFLKILDILTVFLKSYFYLVCVYLVYLVPDLSF